MQADVFLDTNIFIASLTDEPGRGDRATDLMNLDLDFTTSLLNLMELRTVLTKKKRVEQSEVEAILKDIGDRVTVCEIRGRIQALAMDIQQEHLLYPMDALILASARFFDTPLATFDSELLDAGGVPPRILINKWQ